ncbi:type ISP restriction/modification enzyme [Candidatus Poriferisocius sp.]|uniref:type ISP restriction/modification enzyme n=1 Tax=Candidatus Poriferisocius sp. TaxID=3101276 RepID=UPI003B5C9F86
MSTTIIDTYLREVRATLASGVGTKERSHYPALKQLLRGLGGMTSPRVRAETDPASVSRSFPDLVVIEAPTNVLVLPVEAKPPKWSIQDILDEPKTRAYAMRFGGGRVMVTNLHTFALAEFDSTGSRDVLSECSLIDEADLTDPSVAPTATDDDLAALLKYSTALRATLVQPKQVAHHLAEHAVAMRDQILDVGDAKDLLRPIWDLFESGLGTELDDEFFVPAVVQTLVYGLFAGWVVSEDDPTTFDWQSAAYRVEVPLFADVLHASLSPQLIRRCDLFPRLAAIAGVLRRVDRDRFNEALAVGAIEYFYEPFLAEFDPLLRDRLGVWYTPREVAEFQVAACDYQLRHELGIASGLADENVVVLDPAVGTGTYLKAVYRFIYQHHVENGEAESVAAARAKDAALKRIIGFEILPAAFIIGHYALSQTLANLGAPVEEGERLRVYLTNSLTGWDPTQNISTTTLFPDFDDELEEARQVKQQEPVIVILGNPPYEGYSSAESDEEKELIRPWVDPLYSNWGIRKHRLNDLYARFWAAAIGRIVKTERGVVSFITNSQWLTGRSYPEMRRTVLSTFDMVQVVDLHGDVHDRSHPEDQSIFTTESAPGIQVGTAIVTATRIDGTTTPAQVHVQDLRGAADQKRSDLAARHDKPFGGSTVVTPTLGCKWRFSSGVGSEFPCLDEYFLVNDAGLSFFSGVQPGRGNVATDQDRACLEQRIKDYFDPSIAFDDLAARYPDFAQRQARYDPPEVRRKLLGRGVGFNADQLKQFLFRPMDVRWLYWETEHKFLTEPRKQMLPFWNVDGQRALVVGQTRRRQGAARPVVASQVPSYHAFDPDARVFPLWRPDVLAAAGGTSVSGRTPAIDPMWIAAARAAGSPGSDEEVAERLFYAIAGVCLSAKWLASQEMDSGDFPYVPLPSDPAGLEQAANVGRRYADLVDPDIDVEGVTIGSIDQELRGIGTPDVPSGSATLTKGSSGRTGGQRSGTAVLWSDIGGWRNVPDDVWNFRLGGYAVLSKLLSYRVGTSIDQGYRESVMLLVRRIQAINLLIPVADKAFAMASANPLD